MKEQNLPEISKTPAIGVPKNVATRYSYTHRHSEEDGTEVLVSVCVSPYIGTDDPDEQTMTPAELRITKGLYEIKLCVGGYEEEMSVCGRKHFETLLRVLGSFHSVCIDEADDLLF